MGQAERAPERGPAESGALAPLIAFESVGRTFGAIEAVNSVDLSVQEGEFVCLLGPSGCGKSTLLNMTAGLFQPSLGVVRYRGEPVTDINRRTGYMTQSDHLLPWRSVWGNIAVPLEIAGASKSVIAATVERLVKLVGLAGFEKHYPTQLSGGMRKRTALARLLAYDPETLLMDEPFGALDAQLRLALQIELKRLCRKLSKAVLFVTHDVDEAVALADRIVVFSGRPGTIREIVPVALPADRNIKELKFSPEYMAQCAALWRLLTPAMESCNPETEIAT